MGGCTSSVAGASLGAAARLADAALEAEGAGSVTAAELLTEVLAGQAGAVLATGPGTLAWLVSWPGL